ncbi:MAG: NADH-quinone oxidoreductase subunit N, partial [Terriglobales bacterium]
MRGLSPIDYRLMLPMVELTIFALGILLIDLMVPRGWKWINALGAFVGVLFAAVCVWQIQSTLPPRGSWGFYNALLVDRFAVYFWYLFLA